MNITGQIIKIGKHYRSVKSMDKLIQLCLRSIVSNLNGDIELSEQYKELALDLYFDSSCITRVEDHVDRKMKRKLYEMVS